MQRSSRNVLGQMAKQAAWWGWIPLVLLIAWAFVSWATPGFGDWRRAVEGGVKRQLFPGGFDLTAATPLFWLMVVIGLIGSLIIFHTEEGGWSRRTSRIVTITLVAGVILSIIPTFEGFWDNDKDEARFYNASTVFYTPSLDKNKAPSSMGDLLDGAKTGDTKCQRVGKHDVPSCINEGTLPNNQWEARTAPLAGASYFLKKKTGDKAGADLMPETVTYLYNTDGEGGKWTGIRDGSGRRVPMFGVVEWDGKGDPNECYFNRDDYNFNRALNGTGMNNLDNLISEKFLPFYWDNNDVWGYCDGSKPVIVVPLKREINYKVRTVEVPAGVLVVRGSASGDPVFDLREHVKPGELPGPAYPVSLVAKQRDMVKWAAGRGLMDSNFGYEATDADAQMGNASEYLLRNKRDHRLYWVSPMTPRGDSQLFVAYAMTPADVLDGDTLNTFSVYVLSGDDPRQIDVGTLDNTVKQAVSTRDPAFFSSGGKVIEYLPTDSNTTWQVFAERNGKAEYVITVDRNATKIPPTLAKITDDGRVEKSQLVTLSSQSSQPTPPPSGNPPASGTVQNCSQAPGEMSETQLAQCLGKLADEYRRRHPN